MGVEICLRDAVFFHLYLVVNIPKVNFIEEVISMNLILEIINDYNMKFIPYSVLIESSKIWTHAPSVVLFNT